jgi:hypothetical protein
VKFTDYSPPSSPSPEQQRDALQEGLGRALKWALNGRLGNEPLLAACLRDQRFDTQVEESRGEWLWRMIQAVGATERFRVPILHAFYDLSDERSANQLCELARHYAATGDETIRTLLYEIVERKPFPDSPGLGEEEIVTLDGEQAFLFSARARGQSLVDREWDCWDDGSLIDLAIERFGEERVCGLLEASSDKAVNRFWEDWQRAKLRKAEGSRPDSHTARMVAASVEEILRAAESESRCFWFDCWGKHADEGALQTVLQRLWSAREPRVIANLLHVFSARALPQFDARLIELCRHGDKQVRRRAFDALEQNAHPLIREFALTQLQRGLREGAVVGLFNHNYRQRDEQRILEALELPDDACELHWLLMDVIGVLEKNPEADCFRLGIIAYASTPCENCRYDAARLLHQRQVTPEWLKEECRYDSAKECRELVEQAMGPTKAS